MRIAWFTPFKLYSAIGKYSKFAAEAISEHAEVVLFVEPHQPMHSTSLQVICYSDGQDLSGILATFDLIVYNMGDHCEYHKSIYNVMRRHPGMVIAHDICMHHFFHSYYLDKPDEYVNKLTSLYGEEDTKKIVKYTKSVVLWTTIDLLKYNMLRLICENARGVMVHSRYHARKLAEVYTGPTAVIPLIEMYEPAAPEANVKVHLNKKKVNILTVGNVNSNKNVLKVMDAIAGSSFLRKHVRYTVIGEASNEFYLKRIMRKLKKEKLSRNFKLIGYVDDSKLAAYYNSADIICNLRYPAIEGGSASLQEQLLQGKTVIVADTGVYSEVPDDCVIKIDPNDMKESLQEKLTALIRDKGLVKAIGNNAKAYAKEEYSKEKYTAQIIEFMKKVIFVEPLDNTLSKIRKELAAMGLDTKPGEPRLEIVDNIAKSMDEMFACSNNGENQ